MTTPWTHDTPLESAQRSLGAILAVPCAYTPSGVHQAFAKALLCVLDFLPTIQQEFSTVKQSVIDLNTQISAMGDKLTILATDIGAIESVLASDDPDVVNAVATLKSRNADFSTLVDRLTTDSTAPVTPPAP